VRVLVTGRQGQLARSLAVRAPRHRGLELVFAARPELDLEWPETIEQAVAAAAPDVVVNCAAYTAVDQAEDEPVRALRVNGVGAGALAAAARRAGARIIQISTDYVFDGLSPVPYGEDDPTGPRTAYGRSKLAGERAVRQETADHLIVRTAWVYSPFGRSFVKTMLTLSETGEQIEVVDDQFGNPTSALDVAEGLLRAIAAWQRDATTGLGGTYHLAATGDATWCTLARRIFEVSAALGGPEAKVIAISSGEWMARAARPTNSRLDSAKFARDFGYRCPHWWDSVASVVEILASPECAGTTGFTKFRRPFGKAIAGA
jgi:dTDP-4-dehydrorhamnose reductase